MQNWEKLVDQALKTILLPGKGIYLLQNQKEYKQIQSQYTGLIFQDLDQVLSNQKMSQQMGKDISIGVNFDTRKIQNQTWNQFWSSNYQEKVQSNLKAVRVIVDEKTTWTSKCLSFLKNINKNNGWIVLAVYLSNESKKNMSLYQENLAKITQSLMKIPSYILAGITIQLQFLDSSIINFDRKSIFIWRRVIPLCIASISVRQPQPNAMFSIHYLNDIVLEWKLQFTSSDMSKFQKYSFESLGIQQIW